MDNLTSDDSRWRGWRQLAADGIAPIQRSLIDTEAAARTIRNYADIIIPGLLQTEHYARAILRVCTEFIGSPDDTGAAVAARLDRQQILHSGTHGFGFLLAEQALYTRVGDEAVMRGQLERVIDALALPSLELGVIPRDAPFIYTTTAFALHDRRTVEVETISADLTISDPDEVEYYEKVWTSLSRHAAFGDGAGDLLRRAIDHYEEAE